MHRFLVTAVIAAVVHAVVTWTLYFFVMVRISGPLLPFHDVLHGIGAILMQPAYYIGVSLVGPVSAPVGYALLFMNSFLWGVAIAALVHAFTGWGDDGQESVEVE